MTDHALDLLRRHDPAAALPAADAEAREGLRRGIVASRPHSAIRRRVNIPIAKGGKRSSLKVLLDPFQGQTGRENREVPPLPLPAACPMSEST